MTYFEEQGYKDDEDYKDGVVVDMISNRDRAVEEINYQQNGPDDQDAEVVEKKVLPVKDVYLESLTDLLSELRATRQSLQDAQDAIEEVIKGL